MNSYPTLLSKAKAEIYEEPVQATVILPTQITTIEERKARVNRIRDRIKIIELIKELSRARVPVTAEDKEALIHFYNCIFSTLDSFWMNADGLEEFPD